MSTPENGILDFIKVYNNAIKSTKNKYADSHRGSELETLGGFTAVMWSRESQFVTDLFRATRFNDADGDDLTTLVTERYDIERILDTYGVGYINIHRPTASLGAGTIWKGTRIRVLTGSRSEPKFYVIAEDVPVTSSKVLLTKVAIHSDTYGPGSQIEATSVESKFWDPLWDNTWIVDKLVCAEGTSYEQASEYQARVKRTKLESRPGYSLSIINACKAQGAQRVYLFESDTGGTDIDYGLNVCYVGFENFTSTTELIRKCKVALESVRVCGDNLQVLPMANSTLSVSLDIYLNDVPALFDQERLYQVSRDAAIQSIGAGFQYNRNNIAASIYRAVPEVQEVDVILPSADVNLMSVSNGVLNFPEVLTRYNVHPSDVLTYFFPPR